MTIGLLKHRLARPWRFEGSGGGGSTTSTTQNYSPEEAARRTKAMDEAERIYNATSGTISNAPYPGAKPIGPSVPTLQGQTAAGVAANAMVPTVDMLNQATQFGLHDVLYPQSNPALNATIDAAIRPITQSYLDPNGVMSAIRTEAGQANQVGGSRQGVAEGVAAGRYANQVGDTAAGIATEGYNRGLDTFGRTMALAPQSMQSMLLPAQTLGAIGGQREQYQQQAEDYNAASRQWRLNAPWVPLQNYASLIYGGANPTGVSTMSGGGPSTGQKVAGAAMAGLGTYAALASTGYGIPAAALMAGLSLF